MRLEVREMSRRDILPVVDYFINAGTDFLRRMGVDPNKLPNREDWTEFLEDEFQKENKDKEFYYIIWLIDSEVVGHSNINKIKFKESAFMHLHLWYKDQRQKGIGTFFIRKTIPYYFNKFELKEIYCEPYSFNYAPNKILKKLGFKFVKEYETTPGQINFHQKVNQWILTKDRFEEIIDKEQIKK